MSQKRHYVLGALLLFASSAVRLLSYPVVTSDYTYFLAKWFDMLGMGHGLSAFQTPFADYAPLYLYALKLLTFIPVSSLYSIKTLTLLFDIAIAALAVLIYKKASPKSGSGTQFLVFAIVMSVPTFIVNDSLWGQSDAIYAAFVLASLYFILSDRPLLAVLSFALALCVKIQAIFFVPILLGYIIRKREWWQLLWVPVVYALSILPAWLSGGSLSYWFFIYLHQAGEYNGLSVSAQSIFAFANPLPLSSGVTTALFYAGIVAACICVLVLTIAVARTPQAFASRIVLLSLLSASLLPYVLPRMHERYFFLADVFSIVYAFYAPRCWYLPVLIIVTSFISYMPFLSPQVPWFNGFNVDLRVPSVLMFAAIVITTYLLRLHMRAVRLTTYT